ncbi:MAG TPA: rhodanese-like domain-containing protein [Candidatus Babeliales bacterium]|jgi:rhodanese-related sulfurtransferase|nr:rhodanese-like domain-containing protein [Candidatus Babeliales bacterium]
MKLWLPILFVCLLSGCGTSEQNQSKPLVINVLDKTLYDDCHIVGSIHMPFDTVEYNVRNEPKDREIIIYCSNYACTTSHYVAKKLKEQGFIQVKVYAGGMAEWWQNGLPTQGPATKPYLTKKIEPTVTTSDEDGIMNISMQELAEKLNVTMVPKGNPRAA